MTKKEMANHDHRRKLKIQFLSAMALSAAALLAAQAVFSRADWGVAPMALVAMAHIPFTILAAVFGWRILKGLDELQRLIHSQSFVFAITATAIYLLTSNLLSAAGIGEGNRTWEFWPMLWIFYFIRYKGLSKSFQG